MTAELAATPPAQEKIPLPDILQRDFSEHNYFSSIRSWLPPENCTLLIIVPRI